MNEGFKQNFGDVVKSHRQSCGLSKQQLSLMIGVNRLTIRRIEQGKANPTLDVLLRISEGLDIEFAELAQEAEKMNSATYKSNCGSQVQYALSDKVDKF